MKKYIKPSVEEMAVAVESRLLTDSGLGLHGEMGDSGTGQLSRRKKEIIVDDEEDDGGFGW